MVASTLLRAGKAIGVFALCFIAAFAQVPMPFAGGTYTQNFDAATPAALPPGWSFEEAGTKADTALAVSTGSSNGGNTYLLGKNGDFALGGLQSGSVTPTIGFAFTNRTSAAIPAVTVTYTGETWRVGAVGRSDRLDFQYSTDATSLATGTWTDLDALDYVNVPATATGSGAALHSASLSAVVPVAVAPGGTVYFRWLDANASGADDALGVDDFSLSVGGTVAVVAPVVAPTAITKIHAIQSDGDASPLVAQLVRVSAVVTGFFTGASGSREGIYLQEEDAEADGNPATSEGIYVYTAPAAALTATVGTLQPGDVVTVVGKVAEFNGLTQLSAEGVPVALVEKTGTTPLPVAVTLTLPAASATAWERYENMRVQFTQTLTVSGNHTLGQYGELHLSGTGLIVQPTNVLDPNDAAASGTTSTGKSNAAAVAARQAANRLATIVLDDARSKTYPDPTPYLSAAGTRRLGDTVTGLAGILTYRFNLYRLDPQGPVVFVDRNPRPATPPAVGAGATLRVASANVLNYFTTLGDAGRGADDAAEFARQKAKIVASLTTLNADIVGLMEIERHANNAALADLVAALNARAGAGTYAYVDSSAIAGTDSIQLALVYKPAVVSPVGAARTEVSPAASVHNRPPLAQTFAAKQGGAKFTVVVNHFKSKGGAGSGADADQGDGQAAHNGLRKKQAAALAAFVANPAATFGDPDVLIIGDLNAYAEEDPVDILRAAGFTDLLQRHDPAGYSYQFGNQVGSLDHALANASLAGQVTGAGHWSINAAEPSFYDYNLENKTPAQQAINVGTPFRSSDHDPVLIGLKLAP